MDTDVQHLQNWMEKEKRTRVPAAFWSVSVGGKDTAWIYITGKAALSRRERNSIKGKKKKEKKKKAKQIILKSLDEILSNLAYFIPYQFWLSSVKVSQK